MHIFLVVPEQRYLESLRCVAGAFGLGVINAGFAPNIPLSNRATKLSEAIAEARNSSYDRSVIVIEGSDPWPEISANWKSTSNYRVLAGYVSPVAAIATKLEAGSTIHEALTAWKASNSALRAFADEFRGSVSLFDVDACLAFSREFLTFCKGHLQLETALPRRLPVSPKTLHPVFAAAAEAIVSESAPLKDMLARTQRRSVSLPVAESSGLSLAENLLEDYATVLAQAEGARDLEAEVQALRAERLSAFRSAASAVKPPSSSAVTGTGDVLFREIQEIAESSFADAARLYGSHAEAVAKCEDLEAAMRRERAEADYASEQLADALRRLQEIESSSLWQGIRTFRAVLSRIVPQRHFRRWRDQTLVERSGLFEADWYLSTYPDVSNASVPPIQHFIAHGGAEGRAPGPKFSSQRYLTDNPDVAATSMNPLLHYLRVGKSEGRKIHPAG